MKLVTDNKNLRNESVRVNGNVYVVDKDLCTVCEDENDLRKLMVVGFREHVVVDEEERKAVIPGTTVPPASLSSAKEFVKYVSRHPPTQQACKECNGIEELIAYANTLGFNFSAAQLTSARDQHLKSIGIEPPEAPKVPDLKEADRAAQEAAELAKSQGLGEAEDDVDDDLMTSPHGTYSKAQMDLLQQQTLLEASVILERAEAAADGHFTDEALVAAAEAIMFEAAEAEQAQKLAEAAGTESDDEDAAADGEDAEGDEGEPEELLAFTPDGEPCAEWPDPEDSMKMDYLRQMADAYEVEHSGLKKKSDLIDAIKGVMYAD